MQVSDDLAGRAAPPAGGAAPALRRADAVLAALLAWAASLLVVAEIAVLFAGVLARYVFQRPLIWTDELASILFLWLAMLGAVIALQRGEHMRMTAVVATLTHVHTYAAFERTAALGALLADGVEAAAARHGLPWRAHRLGGRSGFCLEPELPRTAEDAERSLDDRLIDTRRLFLANRGVWEAIASAGPAISFAHEEADVDAYLMVLDAFLGEVTGTAAIASEPSAVA